MQPSSGCTRPLRPWARLNLPSLKLLLSCICKATGVTWRNSNTHTLACFEPAPHTWYSWPLFSFSSVVFHASSFLVKISTHELYKSMHITILKTESLSKIRGIYLFGCNKTWRYLRNNLFESDIKTFMCSWKRMDTHSIYPSSCSVIIDGVGVSSLQLEEGCWISRYCICVLGGREMKEWKRSKRLKWGRGLDLPFSRDFPDIQPLDIHSHLTATLCCTNPPASVLEEGVSGIMRT